MFPLPLIQSVKIRFPFVFQPNIPRFRVKLYVPPAKKHVHKCLRFRGRGIFLYTQEVKENAHRVWQAFLIFCRSGKYFPNEQA